MEASVYALISLGCAAALALLIVLVWQLYKARKIGKTGKTVVVPLARSGSMRALSHDPKDTRHRKVIKRTQVGLQVLFKESDLNSDGNIDLKEVSKHDGQITVWTTACYHPVERRPNYVQKRRKETQSTHRTMKKCLTYSLSALFIDY